MRTNIIDNLLVKPDSKLRLNRFSMTQTGRIDKEESEKLLKEYLMNQMETLQYRALCR